MARPAFYDYEGEEFYRFITELSSRGLNSTEIAKGLWLSKVSFNMMKNGCYPGWTSKKNRERSAKIKAALQRGADCFLAKVQTSKEMRTNATEADGDNANDT